MRELKIKERLARWASFMDGGTSAGFMFFVNFPLPEDEARLPLEVPLWPDKVAQRIERRCAEFQLMCLKAELVDDDRVP